MLLPDDEREFDGHSIWDRLAAARPESPREEYSDHEDVDRLEAEERAEMDALRASLRHPMDPED